MKFSPEDSLFDGDDQARIPSGIIGGDTEPTGSRWPLEGTPEYTHSAPDTDRPVLEHTEIAAAEADAQRLAGYRKLVEVLLEAELDTVSGRSRGTGAAVREFIAENHSLFGKDADALYENFHNLYLAQQREHERRFQAANVGGQSLLHAGQLLVSLSAASPDVTPALRGRLSTVSEDVSAAKSAYNEAVSATVRTEEAIAERPLGAQHPVVAELPHY